MFIDFETRSTVNLNKTSQHIYASHPDTDVLCMALTTDGETTDIWTNDNVWGEGELPRPDLPAEVVEHVEQGGELHAHNAAFEYAIWNLLCVPKYGWPETTLEQWHCTAALAASFSLPRSLARAAKALGLPIRKDEEGKKVMLRMCMPVEIAKNSLDPRWDGPRYVESPANRKILFDYCRQDVLVEWQIHHALEKQIESEHDVYVANERCNCRGIPVAIDDIRKTQEVVQACKTQADEQVRLVTEGRVTSCTQVSRMLDWMRSKGVEVASLTKDVVRQLLETDLPTDVRGVLSLRKSNGLASLAKLDAFRRWTGKHGRACGTILYCGAQATGRFSGRGIQTQNFPRGAHTDEQIERARDILGSDADPMQKVVGLCEIDASPPLIISSCLRSFIQAPPDREFLVVDYASIEARVLAWLAGEDRVLELYREGDATGESGIVYEDMAAVIYDVTRHECTKATKEGAERRQLGKMVVLGCGYGMGWRAFKMQAQAQHNMAIDSTEAKRIVRVYRQSNGQIRQFWSELNDACIKAVRSPGMAVDIGRHLTAVASRKRLKITLPSGRSLYYWHPVVRTVDAPWSIGFRGTLTLPESADITKAVDWLEGLGVTWGEDDLHGREILHAFVPKSCLSTIKQAGIIADVVLAEPEKINQIEFKGVQTSGNWGRKVLYGGLLAENVTQATARDLLAEALVKADRAGYEIVMHVHDEIVAEVEKNSFLHTLDGLEKIMLHPGKWAAGCPIAVEGFSTERYKK